MAGGFRYGAGRPGWHAKAEQCLRIDLRQFNKRSLMTPGSNFTWRWRYGDGGEAIASIGVHVDKQMLRLQFSIGGRDASHPVMLDSTNCHFGGSRAWFVCPRCLQRCLVLFLRGGSFRCRRCGGVAYTSQSEDLIDRSWRRERRIEARLGPDYARPRRMHRRTYERLMAALWDCEEQREQELTSVLTRLGYADWIAATESLNEQSDLPNRRRAAARSRPSG